MPRLAGRLPAGVRAACAAGGLPRAALGESSAFIVLPGVPLPGVLAV